MPGQAMPGQAPMPAMAPQQGPTQQAPQIGPVLAMFDDWQLKSMLDRPEVAGMALAELNRRNQQTRMRMMGMQAQGQMQQNPGTIKDQVLAQSQPVQRNMGGIVTLRRGGPVRFADGTPPQGAQSYPVEEEWWEKELRRMQGEEIPASEFSWWAAAKRQAAKELDMLKRALTYSSDVEKQNERAALETALEQAYGDTASRAKDVLPKTVEQEKFRPSMNYGERYVPPEAPAVKPPTDQAKQPAAARPTPSAPLSGIAQLTKERREQLAADKAEEIKRANAALPEQEALKAAREAQTKAQAREMDMYERLMGDLKEREASLLSPQALLQMAGSISTKRGELMGSLARGASGYIKSVEDYNQRIADKRRDLMQLQAARQSAIAERNVAMAEGDVTRARAAQDKLTQIDRDYRNLQREFEKEMFNREMTERQVVAEEGRTQAAKDQAKAAQTRAERETVPAEVKLMEWLRSPENRKLYNDIKAATRYEERMLKLRELYDKRPITAAEMSFADFITEYEMATYKDANTGAGANSAPPANAVRLKGQQ